MASDIFNSAPVVICDNSFILGLRKSKITYEHSKAPIWIVKRIYQCRNITCPTCTLDPVVRADRGNPKTSSEVIGSNH